MNTYDLPMSKNIDVLKTPLTVQKKTISNRLAIQPMEGADGTKDGAPGELTIRRYDRFAQSGAGLLWFEATAVRHDGRANPHQLWIHEKNADAYKRIVDRIKENAHKETSVVPLLIMQATHSGRYAKPDKDLAPIIAYNNPIFEKENPISPDRIISDDDLKKLEEEYAAATRLAIAAGFDGVDIKACHRYLVSELLSAHSRPGLYGGSLENRMRFFKNCTENARTVATPDFIVTSRMNIYDGFPYPYGFGVKKDTNDEDNDVEPDLTDSIAVIKDIGFSFINITMGNPYVNPHVNRPTDIIGVERMYRLTKKVKKAFPDVTIVSSAPTFLKEDSVYLAAGAVEQGYADSVGFGRMPFAYPQFAKDMLNGQFDKKQTCVTCGKCTELMRGSQAGCAVRDPVYTDLYRALLSAKK